MAWPTSVSTIPARVEWQGMDTQLRNIWERQSRRWAVVGAEGGMWGKCSEEYRRGGQWNPDWTGRRECNDQQWKEDVKRTADQVEELNRRGMGGVVFIMKGKK